MLGLKRGVVKLETHQEEWVHEANRTMKELKDILGNTTIDMEHIGSTAIASIHAKPILDIAIGVSDLPDIMPYLDGLKEKGFVYRENDASNQILFVKGNDEKEIRTHHIHVVKWNGVEWNHYLNFRDYLNAFCDKAMIYDEVKQKLAVRFFNDRK